NEQTRIYNIATEGLSDYPPAKVEDVVKRFQRREFDQKRMFYAYDGNKMIGYVGLTGKDKETNSRWTGYPWLDKGADSQTRVLLFEELEKQCKEERLKILRAYATTKYSEQLEFFRSQGFQDKIEHQVYQKDLKPNKVRLPRGYSFRAVQKEDLPSLEEIAKLDQKMSGRFVPSDYEQYMANSDYDQETMIVAIKKDIVVGFNAMFVIPDPNDDRAQRIGVVVHPDHEIMEQLMILELENRAIDKKKKKMEITMRPDSKRLPLIKAWGYLLVNKAFQLEKSY
ncbi:MAG TPA: hypothetical protein VJ044_08280, partial [Candidatus Hodarchaeales archaeon]|nr:hypothetical protein [Candidatus Hodarchaeales archaeon]